MKKSAIYVLLAALAAAGASAASFTNLSRPDSPTAGFEVTLVRQESLDSLPIPVEWYDMRTYRLPEEPYKNSEGKYVMVEEQYSTDVFGVPPENWGSFLAGVSAVSSPRTVTVPNDSRLILSIEPNLGILKVLNCMSEFGGNTANKVGAIRGKESSVFQNEGVELSRTAPPPLMRCIPGTMDPNIRGRRGWVFPDGPGFLEFSNQGTGTFSAAGALKEGPDPGVVATLNVGTDASGSLWLWFE